MSPSTRSIQSGERGGLRELVGERARRPRQRPRGRHIAEPECGPGQDDPELGGVPGREAGEAGSMRSAARRSACACSARPRWARTRADTASASAQIGPSPSPSALDLGARTRSVRLGRVPVAVVDRQQRELGEAEHLDGGRGDAAAARALLELRPRRARGRRSGARRRPRAGTPARAMGSRRGPARTRSRRPRPCPRARRAATAARISATPASSDGRSPPRGLQHALRGRGPVLDVIALPADEVCRRRR